MTSPELIFIPFALLAIAISAVWLKPIRVRDRVVLAPWAGIFVASMIGGLMAGVLNPLALIALGLFSGTAFLTTASQPKSNQKFFLAVITAVLALALALHRLPGFHNPVIISDVTLSVGAAAFTQYANFDKGAAGLVILAFLCMRAKSAPEWEKVFKQTAPIAVVTLLAVLGTATLTGYVKLDVKITEVTALFLATNLFCTVIAEETFFRGFLQDRLALSLARFRYGRLIAVICSALLFGLAHIAGGPLYVLLAFLGGLGYAYAYHVTQRVEAPIIVHFAVNTVHFMGFTYPHLL